MRVPTGFNVRRNFESRVRPTNARAGRCDFCFAQGGAVAFFFAFFIGRTPTDNGLGANQTRSVSDFPRLFNSRFDRISVVTVDFWNDVPAIGFETFWGVVQEPAGHIAVTADFTVDRDVVVVIDRNQLTEFH